MAMTFHGSRGEVRVDFLAPLASKPHIFMCGALKLSGIVRANVRLNIAQDHGRGGLSLRGVAFMTVLADLTVLAVLESTLPSFCSSYKIQRQETTLAV